MAITESRVHFLWGMLVLYAIGRVCQLYAGRIPTLWIVVLHVVPPALFALGHGAVVYGRRGILAFFGFCVGFGAVAEGLSLRTGFPFGHYHFTDVMGPKLFGIPVLLALAYWGIGYAAWTVALLILRYDDRRLQGTRVLALPLLASVTMTAWDLAMDPAWSMLDHAWIWHDGGPYFGVPISNFFGWFLTAFAYYLAFALYCCAQPIFRGALPRRLWIPAIVLYLVCALGNALVMWQPMASPFAADATGVRWATRHIAGCCVLVSLLAMTPLALFAWLRIREPASRVSEFDAAEAKSVGND
jgi:uncharacterized membrane protein